MNLDLAYRSILDYMDEAVCVLDSQSKIMYMNPAAEKLAGHGAPDPLGKTFDEVFCACIIEKPTKPGHNRCKTVDNGLEISTSSLFDEGRPIGSIVFLKKSSLSNDNCRKTSQEIKADVAQDLAALIARNADAEEVKRRDRFLTGVALATNLLLTNRDDDLIVNQVLELLGYSADVDRVFIFENYDENGEHFHRLRYEWARDKIKPQMSDPGTYCSSFSSFPGGYETLANGMPIKGLTRDLPETAKEFLCGPGTLSFLVVPLFIGENLWGTIGFHDCRSERRWTWCEVSILLTMAGTIGGILLYQKAEDALKKGEKNYRELVEGANSIIMRRDVSGKINFLNKFALKFFGYPEEEIIGKNVVGTIVPATDSTGRDLRKMIEEIGRYPERYAMNINENMRSNGDRAWIAWANRPILNEKGDVVEILCIGNDITDRKTAEEKLKAEHEQLLGIIEFLPDATFVIDKDKKVIAWNRAIEEMTGINKEHIIGKGDYIYGLPFYGDPRPMLIDLIDSENKEIESNYIYIDRKDGRLYAEAFVPSLNSSKGAYVWATASPLYNDKGEIIGSIESIRDITQQKVSADEIKRRDLLLAGIAASANALLIAQDDESDITQALEILGLSANADRIYICENIDPEKSRVMSRIFEWCREGIPHQIDNQCAKNISYIQHFQNWYNDLEMGKTINGSIRGLTGSARDLTEPEISLLKSQGILSLLIVPITIEEKLWGFVGIDDCRSERVWMQSEISILSVAAASIGEMMARRSAERALQRSEENYRALVENINDVIFKLDNQGRFTYMSPVIEQISGHKLSEIIGQPFTIFVHPDDQPGLQASFERLLAGRLEPYEFRSRDKNGKYRHVRTSSRILIENGQPAGFIGVLTDITKRKQAEEKLRETRDYLENLIDYANAPIIVWDPTFRITRVNRAFERLTGLKATQVLGKPLDILFPDMSRDESIDHIQRTLSGERWETVEIPIKRKDGDVRIVQWNSANIYDKDGTSVIATIAQGQDITEQKLAQEQIRFHASLLDQVHNAVIATDLDGKIIYWNKFAETLYQWKAEEVSGKNIFDTIVPGDKISTVYDVISRIDNTGYSDGEFQARRKDGSSFPAYYTFSVVKDLNDRKIGYLGVSVDITERKRAEADLRNAKEAAESATRAKSDFLANMSHEIRTPMNAVIGLTGLMLNTELTPEQSDYIETIRSSGETLLALINDILDFSKIEGGKMELEAMPFHLIDCIEASLDLIAPAAARKGLSLSYAVEGSVPNNIVSDVTRLRQILANLLSNAVKFTKTGEISIIVSSKKEGDSNLIQFAVKDTGIGIPESRMDRLFQSFSQIDTSMTRKYGGTGLGLAISKRLVELMEGSIWVESEEGKGSTFFFTINAKEAPCVSISELEGRKILVVTYEENLSNVVTGHLESWSMLPKTVTSSTEVLEAVTCDKFDMAILDMQMNGIEGLIKDLHDNRHIPIVALGVPRQDGDLFAAVVSRPILPSRLCDALSKAARKANIGRNTPALDTDRLPLRILLAEDNIVNQKVGLRMLERLGYHADVAANGLEVLQALERQPYDVILMDIQMPEMDGLEAARRVRMLPEGKEIYIIAITAHALKGDRETCFNAGMNDYISKPVRIEDLQDALEHSKAFKEIKPALDPTAVSKLRELQVDGEPDILDELGSLFVSNAPEKIKAMADAISKGNADALQKVAHNLKSSSANIGALNLSGICKKLELLGRSGTLKDAKNLLERAEIEYGRVKAALEENKLKDKS